MIKTLRAFNIQGKNVLIRTDFNVPIEDGNISNNFRIKAALPTIKTCLDAGAAVVIMSHMGRPNGKIDESLSLVPVGEELAGLLEMPIKFSDNCISTDSIDTS
ncbi:MAG: phosphoglycerate kinase, partial [Candidatus Neomarinimicrobiota bacterium]